MSKRSEPRARRRCGGHATSRPGACVRVLAQRQAAATHPGQGALEAGLGGGQRVRRGEQAGGGAVEVRQHPPPEPLQPLSDTGSKKSGTELRRVENSFLSDTAAAAAGAHAVSMRVEVRALSAGIRRMVSSRCISASGRQLLLRSLLQPAVRPDGVFRCLHTPVRRRYNSDSKRDSAAVSSINGALQQTDGSRC